MPASRPSATPASRIRAPPRPTSSSPIWVPKILASPAYQQDGVLIITFGEATPGVSGAPVGTLLLSKFLTPGSTNGGAFNPYSIFRTVEDLFGLQRIAAGARTGTTSFASDLLGSQKKKHKKK